MAINVSVQYDGGFLPDIILLTQMLLPSGNPFKCHEEVLYFQLLIPPKRFDIFSPRLGDAQKVEVHSDFSLNSVCYITSRIGLATPIGHFIQYCSVRVSLYVFDLDYDSR